MNKRRVDGSTALMVTARDGNSQILEVRLLV